MRPELPTGTVTFLFTDIEGSTNLLHELGDEAYARALAEHRRVLRASFQRHGGVEVDTQGDAFFVAFPTPHGALSAAAEAQEALSGGPIRVRMGIHTGTPVLAGAGYVGPDVHRAARIAAAGHGGQVLVSSATAGLLGSDVPLSDLGDHRLKDLSAPERIYQLGGAEFRPLKTLFQTNLPVPSTPFLGRAAEVGEVTELVRRADIRCLTLTGPGGTGKTRLALQAAGSVGDAFEGGVWWVPLAPIRDPQLVVAETARVLGAQGDLAEHIGDRRTLILLDNFEQVMPAAAEVASLMARCVGLKVLVTSREALHIGGEWEYAVDPLRERDAVELFMTRAVAARRDFVANGEVRQICRRLDNLPLAIELAAARVKVMSPKALLERLDQRLPVLAGGARDAPERQRTLRATIEWSHELLAEHEQSLFARLSVFRGGWTLEAAERVADADLDTLQSLIDKSLVRQRDERFTMLETIREYAAERLAASGSAEDLRRRHAAFYLQLADDAHPQIALDTASWIPRLTQEHDNFRAVIDRAMATGEFEQATRLCGGLWPFWYLGDHAPEGLRRLNAALETYRAHDNARAIALNGAMALALEVGDTASGRRYAEEALAIHEKVGTPWNLANSRFLLGQVSASEGRWAVARDLLEESVRAFEELGDSHFTMLATRTLAWMYEELGDVQRYRELTEQNYRRARAVGNRRVEARAQATLAGFAAQEGRFAEALAMYQSSLRLDWEVSDAAGMRIDLFDIAEVLSMAGQLELSATIMSAADAWRERSGLALESWLEKMNAATMERLRGGLTEDDLAAAWQHGSGLPVDETVELALAAALPNASSFAEHGPITRSDEGEGKSGEGALG